MKVVKILAAVAASIIGLLVIAAVLVALLFDPNDYKDYVTSVVEERTGRSLRIEDDLEMSFFPWLAVETGGVSIGNSADFPAEVPFATIDRVSARVRLWPLLQRQVDIGTVVIDGLELDLAVDADGRGNWEDLVERAGGGGEPAQGAGGAGASTFDMEGVSFRGAALRWHDASGEVLYRVSELNLETSAINLSRPTDVELRFDALDVTTQLNAQIELSARVARADDASVTISNFTATAGLNDGTENRRASAEIEIAEIGVSPSGEISLGATSVSGELNDAPFGPTELPFAVAWDRASIDTQSFDVAVTGLTTSLSGIDAAWQLTAPALLEQQTVSGTVTISSGSVAGLLALLSIPPPEGMRPSELGNFDLSMSFTADTRTQNVVVTNAIVNALGANLRTDRSSIGPSMIEATIGIAPFRLSDPLRSILAGYMPAEVDVAAIQRLAMSAAINANPASGSATIRDIRAEMLGASITGSLTLTPQAAGSVIAGSLSTNQFEPAELVAVLKGFLADAFDVEQLGRVAIAADFTYDMGKDSAIVRSARLEGFGLSATGQLEASQISDSINMSGQARVSEFRPREVLTRFGLATPDSADPTALRSASVDTRFAVTSDSARFEDLALRLDDSRINGSFVVNEFANPSYRFDLSVDKIDVDRYLPPQEPAGSGSETEERRAGDLRIEAEPLTATVLNGRVSVGALRLASMDFQNVSTNISVGGGRMALESAEARLYGGQFNGAFGVDASQADPTMSLMGRATGLQLEPLITALTGDANFSGTADFDLDLRGHGPTVTDNLRSSAGQLGFALKTGAIEGFNIPYKLCGFYNVLRQAPQPAGNQPERTTYDLIQGTASVSDGIASSNDLLATTGTIEVRGTGRLSLVEQLADYNFEARVTNSIPIEGCQTMDRLIGLDFPLTLKGPVTEPEIQPDYGEILERFARDEVEDRVRERVQDRLQDRLRNLIQ